MIDPALLRDRFSDVRARLLQRGAGIEPELARVAALDQERRQVIPRLEQLRRQRKEASEQVAQAKRRGEDIQPLLASGQFSDEELKALETRFDELEAARRDLLLRIPNLPHASVPAGARTEDNVEVRRHGEPASFAFAPRPHWEIGASLGILDFERAAAMSGARFAVLSGAGARLERALINFMLDLHTREHGYREMQPPFLVKRAALEATGNLPKFEADLFTIAGDWDLFLIPTAEVPLTNLHREQVIDAGVLPLRYTAYTPCFRSEAGSYGTDVRGLIRLHQFDKVELVTFSHPDSSYDELETLTAHAEEVLKRLELPYRTVVLCTGDMGFASAKTYDIEVWLPSQHTYREISSCSNTEAFQARRANIRFKPAGGGKPEFVHTLNGSGLAVGRTLVAILENYQQEDGTVVIPPALRPYMDDLARIEAAR